MRANFNVEKEARKVLVRAVSEVLCVEAEYQGAPGFEFRVGDYTIDRHGVISAGEGVAADAFGYLLNELSARGFVCADSALDGAPGAEHGGDGASDDDLTKREVIPDGGDPVESDQNGGDGDPSGEAETREAVSAEADDGSGKLCINLPLFGITASSIDNLEKLVDAKAWILRKMAGTDALPIERAEKYLRFPWFRRESSPAEVDAYSRLIARLGETVKEKKRITATEKQMEDGDNEKFKARCFLLSLGFIGPEYAQARKILLAPMSGNGSHKTGSGKKAAPSGSTAADSGTESDAGAAGHEGANPTQNAGNAAEPPKCGECRNHCYYIGGSMRTADGDIMDTGKRTPTKYTHYCVGVPSGYRKIKNANDWHGSETAPKWCPLCAETPEASGIQEGGSGTDSEATGAENGNHRNCFACGHAMSEPGEAEGGTDRLFCVVTQTYVSDDACCDEFNR